MKKAKENQHSMCYAVQRYLLTNQTKLAKIPAIASISTELNEGIKSAETMIASQTSTSKTASENKESAESKLVNLITEVSGILVSFANITGDTETKQNFSTPRSTIYNMRDSLILDLGRRTLATSTLFKDKLSEYGLTQQKLETLKSAIESYASVIANPREAIGERSQAIQSLDDKIKSNLEILTGKLDPLMQQFTTTDPVLYGEYIIARRIIDVGLRHKKQPGATN